MKISDIILTLGVACLAFTLTAVPPNVSEAIAQDQTDPVVEVADTGKLDVKIKGTDTAYTVGDLIELDAVVSGVNGDVTYDWKILPPVDFKVWSDGSKILLGTGSKSTSYTVFLAVGVLYKNGTEPTQSLETRIATIAVTQDGGSSNHPRPSPPSDTIGNFGEAAIKLADEIRITDFYSQEEKIADAKLLAANFDLISKQVKDGTITSLEQALNKTREFNRGFANREIWTNWFNGITAKMADANTNGAFQDLNGVTTVWSDIAKGLLSL